MTNPDLIARIVRNEADMSYRKRVQTVFDWLQPQAGDRILDAGCGRGFYLKFVRNASDAWIAGLELELPFVKIAKHALTEFQYPPLVNASLYDPPFPDETFDKII